jgi:hypothetical protein
MGNSQTSYIVEETITTTFRPAATREHGNRRHRHRHGYRQHSEHSGSYSHSQPQSHSVQLVQAPAPEYPISSMVGPPIVLTAPATPAPQQASTAVTRYVPAAPETHTGSATHVTPARIPVGLVVQPAPQPAAIVVSYGCTVTVDGNVVYSQQRQQQFEERGGMQDFNYQDGSVRVLRD